MVFATGLGEVYAVEDQEAAIRDANERSRQTSGGTTGVVQFGWDFTKVVPPWGSKGPAVKTNAPSSAAQRQQSQQNLILYAIAGGLLLFFLFSRR